jgi:lactoylglutathione lyase
VSDRPFSVLGLQQIAVGSRDKSALRRLWLDLLGLHQEGSFRSESENVDEDIAVAGRGPLRVEVDLMQPIDAEQRPRVHEPPLNHVGLWVDDLPAAMEWLEGRGVRFAPGGIRRGAAGHDVCFIHPKGNDASPIGGEGVLIELVQAPAEVIQATRARVTMLPTDADRVESSGSPAAVLPGARTPRALQVPMDRLRRG